jgi:hypothetical protein
MRLAEHLGLLFLGAVIAIGVSTIATSVHAQRANPRTASRFTLVHHEVIPDGSGVTLSLLRDKAAGCWLMATSVAPPMSGSNAVALTAAPAATCD